MEANERETDVEKQQRYIARMKQERGMVQVRVWVPKGKEQMIRDLGNKLRNAFRNQQG